jgi:hypothetical protein
MARDAGALTIGRAPTLSRGRARMMRCQARLGAFAGAGLFLLMVSFMVAPQALASLPPESCVNFEHNVEGSETAGTGSQTGIYSNMRFAPTSDDCIRVSSIGVINGTGQVEWGWVLGWHPNNNNAYGGAGACNDQYYTDPEIFVVWVPIGGMYHCRNVQNVSVTSATFHTMSILDGDGDKDWAAWYEGSQIASASVDFSNGTVVTNGEIHNTSDNAYSHFESLEKRTTADRSTWHDFTSSYCFADGAGSFEWHRNSDTDTEVQSGSGTC